ncbi:hypothetical protein FF38_07938 [Lucilia cuprina]|uniref:Uncharacterized protein n=1 Tax=Lucilia cuprina TaxID=7375 RepID=A0A0L0BSM5_LUCCU|nr:hypothetical protein FF38_07938 [Lucilia cuprina]
MCLCVFVYCHQMLLTFYKSCLYINLHLFNVGLLQSL